MANSADVSRGPVRRRRDWMALAHPTGTADKLAGALASENQHPFRCFRIRRKNQVLNPQVCQTSKLASPCIRVGDKLGQLITISLLKVDSEIEIRILPVVAT